MWYALILVGLVTNALQLFVEITLLLAYFVKLKNISFFLIQREPQWGKIWS